jgi:hypothetical protein
MSSEGGGLDKGPCQPLHLLLSIIKIVVLSLAGDDALPKSRLYLLAAG